jgi:hypothetical protein
MTGDRSLSGYLYVAVPKNVLFAQRTADSQSARSSDSESRQQGGRGVRGRGLQDSSGGAWARQRLIIAC